jgi:hypothetical protein
MAAVAPMEVAQMAACWEDLREAVRAVARLGAVAAAVACTAVAEATMAATAVVARGAEAATAVQSWR